MNAPKGQNRGLQPRKRTQPQGGAEGDVPNTPSLTPTSSTQARTSAAGGSQAQVPGRITRAMAKQSASSDSNKRPHSEVKPDSEDLADVESDSSIEYLQTLPAKRPRPELPPQDDPVLGSDHVEASDHAQALDNQDNQKAKSKADPILKRGRVVSEMLDISDLEHAVPDEGQALVEQLKTAGSLYPVHLQLPPGVQQRDFRRIGFRDQDHFVRDVLPLFVPSAEYLRWSGHPELKGAIEEVSHPWTELDFRGITTPALTVGIDSAHKAFTERQMAKLQEHALQARPTFFTDMLCFPFFICGFEGPDPGDFICSLNEHNRNCATAVDALVQLHQASSQQDAESLSGHPLVFSCYFTPDDVLLQVHYARVAESDTKIRRCHLLELNTFGRGVKNLESRVQVHWFCQNVLTDFFPIHLERVTNMVANL